MNAKTLTALKESIAHWKRMRDDPNCGEEPYTYDCALCLLADELNLGCKECIIGDCELTPYVEASEAWDNVYFGPCETTRATWRAAAQAEIDFLESLLPGATT